MLSKIKSAGLFGIEGHVVTVECDSMMRKEKFEIVGLPDNAIKEAKERIKSALFNSGFYFPETEVTVNLAPADLKKAGSSYDYAILIAILRSTGQIPVFEAEGKCFVGELSLDGTVRRTAGTLNMALAARDAGITDFYTSKDAAAEASAVSGINVYGIENIKETAAVLAGEAQVEKSVFDMGLFNDASVDFDVDFSDVKGQERAKRAIEIACAGGHNLLMIGPPGAGKSMLARRIPTIMPPLSFEEALECTKIYSASGNLTGGERCPLVSVRPFRAPHHTASRGGLAGGGTIPMPGEISLAHNGVLFLDELPEFGSNILDILRQPLESGKITLTRVSGTPTFPANFMLICAMNPCKCGFYGDPNKKCTCTQNDIKKYLSKVSGPILDRIDIHIELPSLNYEELSSSTKVTGQERTAARGTGSAEMRERVVNARKFAGARMKTESGMYCNAALSPSEINEYCEIEPTASELLRQAFDKLGLSARGYDRILRVARTIADLDESDTIKSKHIAEAIQLRSLDRKYWQRP
ncbi:MAG: YifB family Mg chelatase-like AAA ATPase [Clostridia bacterium]|nr:YifB family Mg chelatase-like AAA ATPase [Clostridia bacterium]